MESEEAGRINAIVSCENLRARVVSLAVGRVDRVRAIHAQVVGAAREREAFLAHVSRATRRPVQPGIFDARAVKAGEQADQERAGQEQDRVAGAPALDQTSIQVLLAPPELALLLVVPR